MVPVVCVVEVRRDQQPSEDRDVGHGAGLLWEGMSSSGAGAKRDSAPGGREEGFRLGQSLRWQGRGGCPGWPRRSVSSPGYQTAHVPPKRPGASRGRGHVGRMRNPESQRWERDSHLGCIAVVWPRGAALPMDDYALVPRAGKSARISSCRGLHWVWRRKAGSGALHAVRHIAPTQCCRNGACMPAGCATAVRGNSKTVLSNVASVVAITVSARRTARTRSSAWWTAPPATPWTCCAAAAPPSASTARRRRTGRWVNRGSGRVTSVVNTWRSC